MLTKSIILSAPFATLLLMGMTQTASADWKGYAGANCMQQNQNVGNFRRTSYGYINDNADARMVICPVVRDIAAGGDNRITAARVTLTSTGNSYCRLYSRTRSGNYFATQFRNFGAGDPVDVTFNNLDASNWGSYTISCRIPGVDGITRSYVRSYAVDEN